MFIYVHVLRKISMDLPTEVNWLVPQHLKRVKIKVSKLNKFYTFIKESNQHKKSLVNRKIYLVWLYKLCSVTLKCTNK